MGAKVWDLTTRVQEPWGRPHSEYGGSCFNLVVPTSLKHSPKVLSGSRRIPSTLPLQRNCGDEKNAENFMVI